MMNRYRILWIFLAMALSACATAPKSDVVTERFTPFTLTFLLTTDLQGLVEPQVSLVDEDGDGVSSEVSTGGIARIASVKKAVQAEDPTAAVIFASTGDDLMGKYFHSEQTGGASLFDLMSLAGYDIFAFGNHEFDKGPEKVGQALTKAAFPVIATDLVSEGTPIEGKTQRSLIRAANGLNIGYFSLMTEDFPLVTSGGSVKIWGANHETAAAMVASLKAEGADIIVALTHLGSDKDQQLAAAVPGIDVILGGHSHDYLPEPIRQGNTLIINGGEKGTYVARLDIPVTADRTLAVAEARYQLIPLDSSVPEDSVVAARLAEYKAMLPAVTVVGTTEKPWNLTSDVIRRGDAPVPNMITDALREKFQADLVLLNAGSFRGKKLYPAGPITDEMIAEIDEFENYIFSVKLPGSCLKAILERSAACYGEGGLMQVSGLRYAIDLTKPAQVQEVDAQGIATGIITPGERVTSFEILTADGWVAVDPDRQYSVLTSSFIFDKAGDGYFWFKALGTEGRNLYSTLRSILAELAAQNTPLNPREPDGRITVTGLPQD